MAQPANGNVVPLGEHPRAKARLSPRESADALTACRELALTRMTKALAGMLDRLEDDLFELAEKAIDRDVQNTYLDARTQAREKRPEIEGAFRRHFVEFFNRKVEGDAKAKPQAEPLGELTLVEDDDLEERIAVRDMSRKLEAACETELFPLSQRMGFLLERPDLDDEANPLAPATVCAALKDACDQINASFKVRLALLRQLERYTEVELQGLYRDVNVHLVERRILPDVRHGVRRAAPSAPKVTPPSASPTPTAPAPTNPQDIFGTLAQLLGGAMPGGVAAPGGVGVPGMPPGSFPPGQAAAAGAMAGLAAGQAAGAGTVSVPASFLTELTRMQEGPVAAALAPGAAPVNVVKGLRASPQSASLPPIDAMTMDIVSMLFDYIFEDRHIPDTVKAWLARLQIPMLKVALLDKNFFSSKQHPARLLIDRLAECAIGLDEGAADGAGCIALVENVVQRVLDEFETDLAIFDTQLKRVEAFIEERKRAEDQIVERSARLVEERERVEIARAFAEDEVERRLAVSPWVPAVVREMLGNAWVQALVAARADGENSPAWQALVKTMEDLVWSVEPKVHADDRKRLVAMLPALIKSIVEGLRRSQMDDAARTAFLGALVDCHAAAVKSGLRGMAALPEAPVPVVRAADPSIARETVPAGDIHVEEIRLRTPRGGGPVRNVFTRTGIWTNLQRGTWVEFGSREAGATQQRARLTWISPNKGVYLFTNPLATKGAVSISPEALAEQMRLGEARVLDDAPLMDRAVGSMIENLRSGAEARAQ
jgi:hypothetical protein